MPAKNVKSFTIFAFVLLSLTPLDASFPHPFFEDDYYQHRAQNFLSSEVHPAVFNAFNDELAKVRDTLKQMFEGNRDMLEIKPLIGEALDQIPNPLRSLRSSLCKLGSMIEEIFLEAREEVLRARYRVDKVYGPLERLSDPQYRELIRICYTDVEHVLAQLEEAQAFINALISCPQPQYPALVPYRRTHQMIRSRL